MITVDNSVFQKVIGKYSKKCNYSFLKGAEEVDKSVNIYSTINGLDDFSEQFDILLEKEKRRKN